MDWKWLYEKIEKIDSRGDDQARTLERLTVTVEEHVRRTNLLEERMRPVENHVIIVNGILKLLLGVASLSAIIKLFI